MTLKGTTICAVKKDGKIAVAGDGQVTMGESTIFKATAHKVRRIFGGKVVTGFAGTVSDAFALCDRFEAKLEQFSGNLEYEIPVTTEDEMGYLSASLNYMSSQLRDMEDYQKKFVANVSHDFRSPLTSIKGYVEAMLDGTIPPEMQERYLNVVLSETNRLTKLTKGLLTLNNFDDKGTYLELADFDINAIIRQTV